MTLSGWKCMGACVIACGLWIGCQAVSDRSDDSPSALHKKGLDNMQYFGRLGKREFEQDGEVKRLDPSMFGRLGKREQLNIAGPYDDIDEAPEEKRLDSRAYFGRLGKRFDGTRFLGRLGKRNVEKEQISRLLDELSKRGLDSTAYFGRLGKRPYDRTQFYGRLG